MDINNKKIKVLIVTGIFAPDIGGPATYAKLLLENLSADDFELSLINFGNFKKYPKIIRHIFFFFYVLKKAVSKDLIFALDLVSVGLPTLVAGKILGKKIIVRMAGDHAWEQGCQRFGIKDSLDDFSKNYKGYPFLVRLLKKAQYFVAQKANLIIVPSEYLKTIVQNWGIKSNKIKVIYNSVNVKDVYSDKAKIRQELHLEGLVILTIGRLVPWKGFRELIKLFPELKKTFSNLSLLIIGDGPMEIELKQLVKEKNLENSVFLKGKFGKDELYKYIKASDLFILNTHYEGFSHQLLEVMLLGTPVITTRVEGNIELIDDGRNGILVEYNNFSEIKSAAEKILLNDILAKEFANNAKTKASQFSRERMISELIAVFKNYQAL
ncbi:MAG: glycosyltransferase family 4 protein [Patescibacteria group bacterium]|nr:glycosyltransferase family 4 protein [Patescibacteria group bacterium]MDD4611081.1 glycosyltransferase family 4 protein [Patescibacteria group bacterium]